MAKKPVELPLGFPTKNRDELATVLKLFFGLTYPRQAVCPGHTAPFEALAEAYFAEQPVTVWWAARGFGGKTTLLAGLALIEILDGYTVSLLGGSGEQTRRTHEVTTQAWQHDVTVRLCKVCLAAGTLDLGNVAFPEDPERCMCGRPLDETGMDYRLTAPRQYLKGGSGDSAAQFVDGDDPLATRTEMVWGNEMVALTASSKAVRGPHPQRLRIDEAEEADLGIIESAMGQTLLVREDMPTQTVFASTHHKQRGAMKEVLKRARERGWPVRKWCHRETLVEQTGGWLLPQNVEAKKSEVSQRMWNVEYELGNPEDEEGLLIPKDVLAKLFTGDEQDDPLNVYIEMERPDINGDYVTAADWAKKRDRCVIVTIRYDCEPAKLVGIARMLHKPWPRSIAHFNERVVRFGGKAIHDATGVGDVAGDMLTVEAEGFQMVGKLRTDLFLNYENVLEKGRLTMPRLASLIGVHEDLDSEDLYGGGHPPDEIVALALAMWLVQGQDRAGGLKKRGKLHRPRSF